MEHVKSGDTEAREVAGKFLQAIREQKASDFWNLLDRQGQGYFMGLWFHALVNANVEAIIALSGEPGFLQDALGEMLGSLNASLEGYMENPTFGEVDYVDDQHAYVAVFPDGKNDQVDEEETEYIPLVLELAPGRGGDGGAAMSLTRWRVDALKCIGFNPAAQ
jgi:hypothetical protein